MKKLVVSILTVLLVCTCFGCSKPEEKPKDQLTAIKEKGTLTVAMEGMWSPWTYHDTETGELVGFDTEVAAEIAKKLGVAIEYKEGDFDAILAGLDDGRYDLVVNGVSVSEERKQKYNFTEAYAFDSIALIVNADETEITKFEDLNGKTTANTLHSVYANIAEQYGATVTGVETLEETLELLNQKRINATLNSFMSYTDYVVAKPESTFKVVAFYPEKDPIAIPLRKEGSESLKAAIDQALNEMRADGTLAALSNKYFGQNITEN